MHNCGGTLLSATKVLTSVSCVQGTSLQFIRVVAGLNDRQELDFTQVSYIEDFAVHEQYSQGSGTFNNDIATLHLVTPIEPNGVVAYAMLPEDNSDLFVGATCTISGWGHTDRFGVFPWILQWAYVGVISESSCSAKLSSVAGAGVGSGHICAYEETETIGSCHGDNGGPLNCPTSRGIVVAGVASWNMQGGGTCLQTYPSVYTRTSAYLDWIAEH